MSNVDEQAKVNGIRFRHYYSRDNKLIATIATKVASPGGEFCVVDIGVSLCSIKDKPNKEKAKLIAMGRVLNGSKKFMTSLKLDVLRSKIRDMTLLDLFVDGMHPEYCKRYVTREGKVRLRDRTIHYIKHEFDANDGVIHYPGE